MVPRPPKLRRAAVDGSPRTRAYARPGCWPLLFAALLVSCGDAPLELRPDGGLMDAGRSDRGLPDAAAPDAASLSDAAAPENRPPTIERFTANPSEGLGPLDVRLAWAVSDPDGDPLRCGVELAETATAVDCAAGAVVLRLEGDRRVEARLAALDPAGARAEAGVRVDVFAPFTPPPGARGPWGQAGAGFDPDALGCAVRAGSGLTRLDHLADRMRAARPTGETGICRFVLPPGEFRLGRTLALPSGWLLAGAGADRTRIRVDLGGRASPAIQILGRPRARLRAPATGAKGEARVELAGDLSALEGAGPLIGWVSAENDPARLPERWARPYSERAVGQLFRVRGVEGQALLLDRPLAEDHEGDGPFPSELVVFSATDFATGGVMDLALERVDDAHTPIIHLDHTLEARVLRVESRRTGWAHVAVDRSLDCAVRRSAFLGAHGHGGGGRAYGVNLRFHTTGCLVEDDVFDDLRHALIVQLGANQNVFGYNYSTNSHDEFGLPKADISTHGHYAHLNLFEGNVVERAHVADWWGPTPHHVLWKNRITRAGLEVSDGTEGVVLVDNVVTGRLRVDSSIRNLTCAGNISASGEPKEGGHPACDRALNDPAAPFPPRRPSLYRQAPLRTEAGTLPAEARARACAPVPPPPGR